MWLSMEHILLKLQRPSRAVDRRSVDRSDVSDLQDSGFALVRQKESKASNRAFLGLKVDLRSVMRGA